MENNDDSKIRKNGRPKLPVHEKKTHLVKCMMDEKQIKKAQELNRRFAPYLSLTDFARVKILDESVTRYGIRDLGEEELKMLHEIALLGNQFHMVARRNNITLNQERAFIADSQKIREVLDSTHRKVLELQNKELYFSKISEIVERFNTILFEKEKYEGVESLISDISLIVRDLSRINEAILSHKK